MSSKQTKISQPKKQKTPDMGDLPPWRQGMQSWQIKVYFRIPEPKDVLILVVDWRQHRGKGSIQQHLTRGLSEKKALIFPHVKNTKFIISTLPETKSSNLFKRIVPG